MSSQHAIIARFVAKEGCAEELLALLLESAKIALEEEPGCRRFEILQGVNDVGELLSDTFMSNELFDDYAAVEAHRNSWRTPIRRDRIRALAACQSRIEMAIVQGVA